MTNQRATDQKLLHPRRCFPSGSPWPLAIIGKPGLHFTDTGSVVFSPFLAPFFVLPNPTKWRSPVGAQPAPWPWRPALAEQGGRVGAAGWLY